MNPTQVQHHCQRCRRPRSENFHHRHPAGPGYPPIHSLCRRCRQPNGSTNTDLPIQLSSRQSFLSTIRRAINRGGARLVDATDKRPTVQVHVHHHHWYPAKSPTEYENGIIGTSDNSNLADSTKLPQYSMKDELAVAVAELADGPGPAPSELPADRISRIDKPPEIRPKPVLIGSSWNRSGYVD